MKEYQAFPISNNRTGFDEALEPWLLPKDGYQVMQNAHLYRGVVEKINGYDTFARMSYRQIIQLAPAPDGIVTTFTATLPAAPSTNNFYGLGTTNANGETGEVFAYLSDASATVINLGSTGGAGIRGTVNLTTLLVTLNFVTPPVAGSAVIFVFDSYPATFQPIMGIKPYFALNGGKEILIFDTLRVGKIVPIISVSIGQPLSEDNGISEIPHAFYQRAVIVGDGVTVTFTGTFANPLQPGTVVFKQFSPTGVLLNTYFDNGLGGFTPQSGVTAGFINYFTGAWTITFSAAPALNTVFDDYVGIYGNLFTGGISNFFDLQNYTGKAFFTNSIDPPMYYNGLELVYLNTNLTVKNVAAVSGSGAPTYDITKVLHLTVFRERLILLSVTLSVNDPTGLILSGPNPNVAYWSKVQIPTDFSNDEFLPAPTSEPIVAFALLTTNLIVRFSNSERILQYTNDAFSPFRWDTTNNIWRCDAPYGVVNYDSYFTSIGKPAIVASDGVNIKRADEIIPDFTDPQRIDQQTPALFLSQSNIQQCYGERFDDFKEGWTCYRSAQSNTLAPSDTVLSFNYLDGTYATFTFPFSCLGFGNIVNVPTWGNDYREWISISDTWGSFHLTEGGLVDLAGDQFGNVFEVDDGYSLGADKSGTITAMTNASPAQFTDVGHGLNTGDQIVIQGLLDNGTPPSPIDEINNHSFVVTRTGANTFTIPLNTTNPPFPIYGSGGTWFTTPLIPSIITANFNPFIEDGQLVRFGYLDLFVSANSDTTLHVQFFKDDQMAFDADGNAVNFYQETSLVFTPTAVTSTINQTKIWKRIYIGAVGKEHTIRFYQSFQDFTEVKLNQPIKIHAMVLYMKPAGRIFQ